jgi:hypothetical protein
MAKPWVLYAKTMPLRTILLGYGSRSEAPPGTRSILGYLMIDLLNSIGTLPANPTIQPLSRPDQRPGEVLASRVGTAPLNSLSYFS